MKKLALAAAAAVMLLFAACGEAPEGPDVLQVFAADPSERGESLTRPSDAALWDELGLAGAEVTSGESSSRTVGGQEWQTVRAALSGDETELYFRRDLVGEWQLDLRASFGVNPLPLTDWENENDILTVRVTASLADELPGPYKGHAATHAAAELRDYTGEGSITAAFPKTSSDGEALLTLLSDGKEHRVLLRLRQIPEEFWEDEEPEEEETGPVWRVTQYVAPGWFDEAAVLREQNPELLQAVRQGRTERVQELLTQDNVQTTDENGDSLLYLALSEHMTGIAELLIKNGCPGLCDNIYWHDMPFLLDFERQDVLTLTNSLRQTGGSPGCTAESLAHYLVERSNSAGLELYLSAYLPQYELSAAESRALAGRYGLDMEEEANLLDVAVLDGNPQTAELLLSDGIQASELLKEKLRLQPTSFSDQMLAVLGRRNYFGVMDGVLRDYAVFRESYLKEASDAVEHFHKYYNRYLDAEVAGEAAEARAVMDANLLPAIERQLEAVQKVERPESEAIGELWDLMYEYADMMDTAGYYYKRTSYST